MLVCFANNFGGLPGSFFYQAAVFVNKLLLAMPESVGSPSAQWQGPLPPTPAASQHYRQQQLQRAATLQRSPRGQPFNQLPYQTRPEHTVFRSLGVPLDERYTVKKVLGQGAFGRVVLAKDRQTGKKVAIKEIHRTDNMLDIERELLALIKATKGSPRCHPNVVCYYDHFRAVPTRSSEQMRGYIVMEYIEGESLREYLQRKNKFRKSVFLDILKSVARGLQFLHSRDIAHRDVKPANIMLRKGSKQAVLVDLGLACFPQERVRTATGDFPECSSLSGSRYYIAPEILQGFVPLTVDSWMRSDMYALGRVGEELGLANEAFVQMLLHPDPFQRPTA